AHAPCSPLLVFALSHTISPIFLFHHPATPSIYTLSLHDALPIYVAGLEPRTVQSLLHGDPCTQALGMGRRHMVSVRALAYAKKQDSPRSRAIRFLDQREARPFADRDAVPIRVKRPARSGRGQAERMKSVERHETQAVGTPDHGSV